MIFDYHSGTDPLGGDVTLESKDYSITIIGTTGLSTQISSYAKFTLRATNPCLEVSGVPASEWPPWCPSSKPFWDPNMPDWMKKIKDVIIYVGDDLDYELGSPVNRFDEPLSVVMSLGTASEFAAYRPASNMISVRSVTMSDLGYWRVLITAQETKNDQLYTYRRYFYLVVSEPPDNGKKPIKPIDPGPEAESKYLQRQSLIPEARKGKPIPYVYEFDALGEMTIGWTNEMQPVEKYQTIKNSTLVVKGVPQSSRILVAESDDVYDEYTTQFDKLAPVLDS